MFTMSTLAYLLLTIHMFVGLFMIVLILLQRGRGGGLAGAFGGMGGQSFAGTKAGDFFTKLTIGVATFWMLLGCVCVLVVNAASRPATPSIFKEGTKANEEEVKTAPPIRDGTAPAIGDDKKKDDSTGNGNPGAKPKNDESNATEKTNKEDKGTEEKATDKGSADGNKPTDEKKPDDKKSEDDKKPTEQEPPKDTPKPDDKKDGDKKEAEPKAESGDKPAEKTEKPE